MGTIIKWYPIWPWETFPEGVLGTKVHSEWDCLLYSIEVEYNKWEL